MNFAVVGSGVVGLSTALELQKRFPNAKVTVVADKFHTETTSDVAAGFFYPGTTFAGPSDLIARRWINESYDYWDGLCKSRDAAEAGIFELNAYTFSSTDANNVRNHFLEKLLPVYRTCTDDELKTYRGGWKYGSFLTTLVTECRIWLPWATQIFKSSGGEVVQRRIDSFSEFNGKQYAAVFNCTGLGAGVLLNDKEMVPIRGQVIKVRAPWVRTAFLIDLDTYIVPGCYGVITLGGTSQYGDYNLNVEKSDAIGIRQRCEALLPSLRYAQVVREAVGLRPHRNRVRVETETLQDFEGNPLKIVHNYGHGAYGVTSAPGTAIYAVELAKQMLGRSGSKL